MLIWIQRVSYALHGAPLVPPNSAITLKFNYFATMSSCDVLYLCTVLFRPNVQGVLRMTANVHLYGCSDLDIMDDRT